MIDCHVLPIESILLFSGDPFKGCWVELEKPITREEVADCIRRGAEELAETPAWMEYCFGKTPKVKEEDLRGNHIKKIAYFVVHGFTDPISIDVGVPTMGCVVNHMVTDGNHRFAAAIYRQEKEVFARVDGSISYAKEIGLWNPVEA